MIRYWGNIIPLPSYYAKIGEELLDQVEASSAVLAARATGVSRMSAQEADKRIKDYLKNKRKKK